MSRALGGGELESPATRQGPDHCTNRRFSVTRATIMPMAA
jgi:hypothetical protein